MKKKIFVALMAVMLAVTALAVPAAAFEFKNDDSMSFDVKPTKEAVEKMVEVYVLQEKMGFVKTGTRPLTVSFDNDKGYVMLLVTENEQDTTASGANIYYLEATRIYAYYWSNEGWVYESHGVRATKMGVYRQFFYYSADPVEAYGAYSAFEGINDTITYGTSELNATEILSYYQTLYDYITNYETNLESVKQAGYNQGHTAGYNKGIEAGYDVGYKAGQAECESTHEAMTDEAYSKGYAKGNEDGYDDGLEMGMNVGYDMGYETGYDEGYETGCDEGYEPGYNEGMAYGRQEGYAYGYSEGHYQGYLDGSEDGYLEGKADGYDDGYSVGYQTTKDELVKQYTKGYNNGKEAGITEAVNTKETVIDFVDGLFSAPVNFLYTMLDVEIFGMNLFNIVMVFLTVVLVGVVLAIIFKFRG